MKKIKAISQAYGTAIIFFSFMIFFFLYGCFGTQKTFSSTENRSLQQKPAFSISTFANQTYQKNMESSRSDQFYQRSFFVDMKTNLERKFGKVKFKDVLVGKHNVLFQESTKIEQPKMKTIATALNNFATKYKNLNISMMLVPNKATVWNAALPWSATNQDQQTSMSQFHAMLNKHISWTDVTKALMKHKKEYIYYRSDHHWTTLGASYAFQEWKKQNLKDVQPLPYTLQAISNSFFGTLANQSGDYQGVGDVVSIPVMKSEDYIVDYVNEQKKTASVYHMDAMKTNNPYDVFFGGNHPLIQIHTTSKRNDNLLIMKDSYANSFIPFLLAYYRTITVVDPRYYYDDLDKLIKDNDIQQVLFLYNVNTFFSDTSLTDLLKSSHS